LAKTLANKGILSIIGTLIQFAGIPNNMKAKMRYNSIPVALQEN
jgi:hypothetical protein